MHHQPDVVIAGAGVIGMALALELSRRGRRVVLLDRATAGSGASHAAAGMLAAHDPANPPALLPLARFSAQLYPALLDQLASLVPTQRVSFETDWTLEASPTAEPALLPQGMLSNGHTFQLLPEHSLDPRRLAAALRAAVQTSGVHVLESTASRAPQALPGGFLRIDTATTPITCAQFVDCTGAWSALAVRPVKGQILRLHMNGHNPRLPGRGNVVLRTPGIYLVPRADGSMVVGSTLEDKGFCLQTHDATIAGIRARAGRLYPAVADAPELERWAGLRPATPDGLPVLGILPHGPGPNAFVAGGHFRNGILLAPGTARVMAQLLCGETPSVPLAPFNPARFTTA